MRLLSDEQMISNRLGQYMHAHTIYGGYRPYGVTAVLQAYDERDKQAYLHVVEPSGVHFRYHGCAIGKSQQAAKTEIEKLNFSAMTVREGLQEIARIIHTIHDEVKDKPFVFEAGWICEESGWKHQIVPKAVRDEAEAWGKARVEEADMSDDDE
jgi:20S proteasome subunit alpha 7